jgi:hypothetical protein
MSAVENLKRIAVAAGLYGDERSHNQLMDAAHVIEALLACCEVELSQWDSLDAARLSEAERAQRNKLATAIAKAKGFI